jgi:hypothetical protein
MCTAVWTGRSNIGPTAPISPWMSTTHYCQLRRLFALERMISEPTLARLREGSASDRGQHKT